MAISIALVVLLLVGGAAAYYMLASEDGTPSEVSWPDGTPAGIDRKDESESYAVAPPTQVARTLHGELDVAPLSEGLQLELTESQLTVYPASAWYQMRGWIVVDGAFELTRLTLDVVLVDAAGVTVSQTQTTVLNDSDVPARPGDRVPVESLISTDGRPMSVRVSVNARQTATAAPLYPESPTVPVRWDMRPPSTLGLTVRERGGSYATNQFAEHGGWLHHDIEITNTGTTDVGWLKLRVEYLDANGATIATRERIAVSSTAPRLRPGQTVLMSLSESVPPEHGAYVVTVAEIRGP